MACPKYDFHIHTKYLGCANGTMEVAAILAECERLGLTAVGFADHINRFEQVPRHAAILEDILAAETKLDVYFGAELNFMACDGEFAFNEQIKAEQGFQFAIGGIHSSYLDEPDLRKLVDIQHRHHLRVCRDPLCDVLVHPYWFGRYEAAKDTWPAFKTVACVPDSYVRELGQAARDTGTAIEINSAANLIGMVELCGEDYRQDYVAYLAALAAEGPMFAIGSDAHGLDKLSTVTQAWDVAEEIGLGPDRIWKPSGPPVNRGQQAGQELSSSTKVEDC